MVIRATSRESYLNALQAGNSRAYEEMIAGFIDLLMDKRAEAFKEILDGKLVKG